MYVRLRRNHWAVESGLHYRRDVTLQEDAARLANHNAAHNLAKARRFWDADISDPLTLLLSSPAHFPPPSG